MKTIEQEWLERLKKLVIFWYGGSDVGFETSAAFEQFLHEYASAIREDAIKECARLEILTRQDRPTKELVEENIEKHMRAYCEAHNLDLSNLRKEKFNAMRLTILDVIRPVRLEIDNNKITKAEL